MQPGERILHVALFPRRQNGVADGHKELQRGLLAQHCLRIQPAGVAKQRGHQRLCVSDAGFLQLGLQRGQHAALDNIQQDIIPGDFKPFAEQQLWGDFDIAANTVVQLILGDGHICRAAAEIERGDA